SHIFLWYNTSAGQQYIVQPLFLHQGYYFGEDSHMRPTQYTYTNSIHIFLQCSVYHHFGSLAQSCIYHFHTLVAQGGGYHLCTPVVPVKANFRDQYPYRSLHSFTHFSKKMRVNVIINNAIASLCHH